MTWSAGAGVPLTGLLEGAAQLFRDHGVAARDDPVGTFAKSAPVAALDVRLRSRRPESRVLSILLWTRLGVQMGTSTVEVFCDISHSQSRSPRTTEYPGSRPHVELCAPHSGLPSLH